jgi:hypothetical protein
VARQRAVLCCGEEAHGWQGPCGCTGGAGKWGSTARYCGEVSYEQQQDGTAIKEWLPRHVRAVA